MGHSRVTGRGEQRTRPDGATPTREPARRGPAERTLALQRGVGNAATGRVLQRYMFRVDREKRDIKYKDDYDPKGKPNVTHVEGEGENAVYKDNDEFVAKYGFKHALEHKELADLAQDLIDLLIRRADLALADGKPYMIGVMEHVEAAAKDVRRVAIATSGHTPAAFTQTLGALRARVRDVQIERVEKQPPLETIKLAAPGVEVTGKEGHENLKACAAKKLVLAVPPADPQRMSEVWYDPEGLEPIMVPRENGLRYHHRQRVPSCEDCFKNLPHLHDAMLKRKEEAEKIVDVHARKPVGLSSPVAVEPDPELAAWAEEALKEQKPKALVERPGEEAALLAQITADFEKADNQWRADVANATKALRAHYRVRTGQHPNKRLAPEEETVAYAPIKASMDAVDSLHRGLHSQLVKLHAPGLARDRQARVAALVAAWKEAVPVTAKHTPLVKEAGAEADRAVKASKPAETAAPAPSAASSSAAAPSPASPQPTTIAGMDPAAFIKKHEAWGKLTGIVTPPLSVLVHPDGTAELRPGWEKAVKDKDALPVIVAIVKSMKWAWAPAPPDKTGAIKLAFSSP
jgi:hypothetical protein